MRGRGWRLALAESCTGGLIAHLLTSFPASDYLVGGAVTYANSSKSRVLGVDEETIRWHGAVSPEVAAAMGADPRRLSDRVRELAEFNPMLGFRGCRLAVV